jgi:hypothetical protein
VAGAYLGVGNFQRATKGFVWVAISVGRFS